jgi:plastocyanin
MRWRWLAFGLAVASSTCGGSSTNPAAPPTQTTSTTTTLAPAPNQPVVTITASGVSPQQVEIAVGGRVTFVNNNTQTHEMFSDPHPIHTDCPPMNDVGVLSPGQTKQTGAFNTARTCSYHDHGRPDNTSLQGWILIR